MEKYGSSPERKILPGVIHEAFLAFKQNKELSESEAAFKIKEFFRIPKSLRKCNGDSLMKDN